MDDFYPTQEEMLSEGWALDADGVWVRPETLPDAQEKGPCGRIPKCKDCPGYEECLPF